MPSYNQKSTYFPRIKLHPWLWHLGAFAAQLYAVTASSLYSFREYEGDSGCTVRQIPFAGFGNLATRQCDPVVEIVKTTLDEYNQTHEVSMGVSYFEASAVVNPGQSDTQVQVPLEYLQGRLFSIMPYIIDAALDANPPLEPFPLNSMPCEITVDDMTITTTTTTTTNHHTTTTTTTVYPTRHIVFKVEPGLNPNLCNQIVPYLNSQTEAGQNVGKVRLLDFEKGCLTIALMVGAAGAIVITVGGIYLYKTSSCNRHSFFACMRRRHQPTVGPQLEISAPAVAVEIELPQRAAADDEQVERPTVTTDPLEVRLHMPKEKPQKVDGLPQETERVTPEEESGVSYRL